MEKQALQLKHDKVWLQWRGDLQDYYDGITTLYISRFTSREDPIDQDGYKEATAFPIQKPNFDVFGIPGRTRKQRGWYQVRQHPKLQPKPHIVFLAPKYLPGVSATGVDLPIELVRLVGKMMSEKLWWWNDEDKRTMMTCALVCRHWAGHFLPKIFFKLFIRSRQRAFGLWQLDRSPANCFHRVCNSTVFVEIRSLSELSFSHLLAQIQCRDIEVILQGPLPRGWKTLRSVHQALPRSLPRSFSNGITTLFLTNIHFQRFSDLTHLVCELSDLQVLACEKVTSGPLPDTIATLPRPRRILGYLGRLETHMMDANMGMSAVVHLLAHLLTNRESPLLARVGSVLALT